MVLHCVAFFAESVSIHEFIRVLTLGGHLRPTFLMITVAAVPFCVVRGNEMLAFSDLHRSSFLRLLLLLDGLGFRQSVMLRLERLLFKVDLRSRLLLMKVWNHYIACGGSLQETKVCESRAQAWHKHRRMEIG